MKKILMTTYYFYPQNTPRAFRAFELAKEMSNNKWQVDIYIPWNNYNYEEIEKKYSISIIKVKNYKKKWKEYNLENKKIEKTHKILIRKIIKYFFSDSRIFYRKYLYKSLKNNKKYYDSIISIGLPVSIHMATSKYIRKYAKKINPNLKAIADYGDPFFYNNNFKKAFYFKYIESRFLENFNFISIPVSESIKYYEKLVDKEKIKIIPQGFNFNEIKLGEYKKDEKIIRIGYSGVFYKKIREPKKLFEALAKVNKNFKLYIYTDKNNSSNMNLINENKDNLEGKIEINGLIDRDECIKKMSELDFLINLENINTGQVASKIIDYSITQRPILSVKSDQIDEIVLNEFLEFNFNHKAYIDLNMYDIKNVYLKFEKLL